ncbi:MAG: FAD-dependent oxidoreductase [Pseudomonadota bacterium]
MTTEKIAIVGAGLSGAVLARTLVDAGFDVTVFEKSGGTGGRLATRRTDHGAFNHGAQYLTAKTPGFRAMLTGLSHAGAVREWAPEGKDREAVWHVGAPGMSGLVKPLLKDVNVVGRTRVDSLNAVAEHVALGTEEGDLGAFDRLVITAPAPQAYDLLAEFDPIFQSLAAVRYAPCWTLMAAFGGPRRVAAIERGVDDGPIGWMTLSFEGASLFGVVVQACPGWSREYLEHSKDDVAELMLDALGDKFGWVDPVYFSAHRWRYALVERPLGTPFLASRSNRVFCAGDGMLGGRAEDAFESARKLADHLKSGAASLK